MANPEMASQPQPEQIQPLTMTFSEQEQEAIFDALAQVLATGTKHEVQGSTRQVYLAHITVVRQTCNQLAHNLHKEIDPHSALLLGLTEFLPPGQLEAWAALPLQEDPFEERNAVYAQYFLEKRNAQQEQAPEQ